jgi:hypothetical protein
MRRDGDTRGAAYMGNVVYYSRLREDYYRIEIIEGAYNYIDDKKNEEYQYEIIDFVFDSQDAVDMVIGLRALDILENPR